MARIFGLMMAGGLLLGAASESKAQFALSVGNPYYGGMGYGTGYGMGYGPRGYGYSSGYAGLAPIGGYGYRMPAYGGVYRGYGVGRPVYGGYGYGYRGGWGRRYRRW
jgi:hypothetical protein